MPVPLSDFVAVRPRFGRSVHLERDGAAFSFSPLEESATSSRFFLTPSVREALDALAIGLEVPAERALTLVGPYGAGKSAFAVFLLHLLGERDSSALELLRSHDPALAARFASLKRPLLPVRLVGSRTSLVPALWNALRGALGQAAPDVLRALQGQPLWNEDLPSPRGLADAFVQAARALAGSETGYGGIVVVVDEMGKFLEFAALHPREGDVFALQELGEAAARSGAFPVLVLGLLHQNPEAYATRLSRTQQAEWTKVAQRFRQITLFPSDIERMDMVGHALEHKSELHLNGAFEPLVEACSPFAPLGVGARFGDLARAAFPLHPFTLLALPALFRRAGQSHRSLFNFLTGEEHGALGRFLHEESFDPHHPTMFSVDGLFDYARDVLLSGWNDASSRAWVEAVEAVEGALQREPALSPLAIKSLKTIGLLSWLHDARLPASRDVLRAALGDDDLDATLATLEAEKRIVWSRARNRYRLWEGGDLDIEAELSLARSSLSGDSTIRAATDPALCPLPRLSARRHSFQTGTLRGIPALVIRARDLRRAVEEANGELVVLLALAENEAAREEAEAFAASLQSPSALIALSSESEALRESARDIAASQVVAVNVKELEGDRAARRELELRRQEAESLFRGEIGRLFAPLLGEFPLHLETKTSGASWWNGGHPVQLDSPRRLGALLSDMADETFSATPILRNELLNRRQLSSAGAAARRALLTAMLARPEQELLGFAGFPPERSMYECALRATGLHQESEQGWRFVAPPPDDPARLRPVWDEMERVIFASPPREVPLQELFETLRRPPYGVSDGALPVLLAAFLRLHEDQTTLYEEGVFKADIKAADWEMLIRRPDRFAVAGCRVEGARRAVVERLASSLNERSEVVPLVKRLLKMTRSFPEFAWKTRAVPASILRLREAIESARSPEKFLFEEVPSALGLAPLGEIENQGEVESFFSTLNGVLAAWSAVAPDAINKARDQVLEACIFPPGEEGWTALREEARKWNGVVVHPLLVPFLGRLCDGSDADSLEGTLALLAHRPFRTWSDSDIANFARLVAPVGAALREARQQHGSVAAPRIPVAHPVIEEEEPTELMEAPTPRVTLSSGDQEAVGQLVKRLRKNLCFKDGTPASHEVVKAALEQLMNEHP